MGLLDLLQSAVAASAGSGNALPHFDQVAQSASPDLLGKGLAAAFNSGQTPPFESMVGQLFGQSNGAQQAGLLNQLLAAAGPALLAGGAGSALASVLSPGATQVTPQQAAQLTPQQVSQIAAQAQQAQPGIVDQVGRFYADHPTLVKTLGGAALAIALAKMKDHLEG